MVTQDEKDFMADLFADNAEPEDAVYCGPDAMCGNRWLETGKP